MNGIYSTNSKYIGWKHYDDGFMKRPDPSKFVDCITFSKDKEPEYNFGVLSKDVPWEKVDLWREHEHRCSCCAKVTRGEKARPSAARYEELWHGYKTLISMSTLEFLLKDTDWKAYCQYSGNNIKWKDDDYIIYVLSNGYVSEPTKAIDVNWNEERNERTHYIVAWKPCENDKPEEKLKKHILNAAKQEGWIDWNPNEGLERPNLPEGTEVLFMLRSGFISVPYDFEQTHWIRNGDPENDIIAYKIVEENQ
jgi:hypothetical protein